MTTDEPLTEEQIHYSRRRYIDTYVDVWVEWLGLTTWEIIICWEPHPEDEYDPVQWPGPWRKAECRHPDDYERARLYFNPNTFHLWSNEDCHRLIVHELMHLVTRDVELVTKRVHGMIQRDLFSMLSDNHEHEVEKTVDRLANMLVNVAHRGGLLVF